MKVKKLNVKRIIIFIGVTVLVILGIVFGVYKYMEDKKEKATYEYKFGEKGYSEEEISVFKEKLNEDELNTLLNKEYDPIYLDFLNKKYFEFSKLDEYISYMNESSVDIDKSIAIVNTRGGLDFYDKIYETDTSKGNLMIVNKFYGLKSDYVPELVEVPATYSYAGRFVALSIYDDLIDMLSSARSKGHTLVVTQGYRSYKDQLDAYNSYKSANSEREADEFVARAGHSEYQTGLSVDIEPYDKLVEDVSKSEEHKWLMENAYKYGFILRYEEGKEDITGFNSNSWRFRYVGKEVARQIYEDGLTFDEYFMYYVNKGE